MTLATFLFAADALRTEDGVSFHVETPSAGGVSTRRVESPADMAANNAAAMAAFSGMMGGVQTKKGSRR